MSFWVIWRVFINFVKYDWISDLNKISLKIWFTELRNKKLSKRNNRLRKIKSFLIRSMRGWRISLSSETNNIRIKTFQSTCSSQHCWCSFAPTFLQFLISEDNFYKGKSRLMLKICNKLLNFWLMKLNS